MAAVGVAHGAADAEPALGEIETVAHVAADAVVGPPLDEVGGHPALHDKILNEMTDFVVDQGRAHRGLVAETFAQAARGVVFAAALPCREVARGADAAFARVQAQHDFTQ